ncbi:MAG: hypothetical protein QOE65_302 [Solirubrobacteraceae bacterium]|jgi:hypothetical protein|nr:hypothetical protein [Solirubrobacteraceae bacterium]
MTPPAATAAGREKRAAAKRTASGGGASAKRTGSGKGSSAKRGASGKAGSGRVPRAKGGLAKPPRASARTSGRATARHATRTVRRSAAPRTARRVSGPSGGRLAAGLAIALPRPQVAPLGPRLVAFASTLPDRSVVDRMVRGRVWIGVLAFLLIGLVAMQVSLLKLNAGIGSAVERSSALERANGELRAQVSQLESGERIQEGAAALGMVMPPAGQISYLQSGGGVAAAVAALRDGRFGDPSRAIPLPGADNPPDPLSAALTQSQDPTAADGSTDTTSGDTTSGDTSGSGTGTSADGTSSGSGTSSADTASSGASSGGGASPGDGSSGDGSGTSTGDAAGGATGQ